MFSRDCTYLYGSTRAHDQDSEWMGCKMVGEKYTRNTRNQGERKEEVYEERHFLVEFDVTGVSEPASARTRVDF